MSLMDLFQPPQAFWPEPSRDGIEAFHGRRPSAPSLRTHIDSINQRGFRPTSSHGHSAVTAGFTTQFTPPDTPRETSFSPDTQGPPPALFQNYLRALHSFDPQSAAVSGEDASLMNASLKEGDLILVHCIHANGWADGTILNSGERGWLPTNYCEAYDHPYIRNLLNAMTQFWDLLGLSEDANLSPFVRQDYIRGLIAGVRYLLERADCLHREAPLVKQHAGVRRMRKGLLADLSSLVQIAKRLQETISEPFAGEVIHVLLEDLVTKAFKVVTRAVGFVDVWAQETTLARSNMDHLLLPQAPATPPVDHGSIAQYGHNDKQKSSSRMVDSAVEMTASSSSTGELKGDALGATTSEQQPNVEPTPRVSVIFTPPDGRTAHRVSLIGRDATRATSGPLASEQLAKIHDICISHIAAFVGLHLHSRPVSELTSTMDKLVHACDNLLNLIGEVQARDSQNFFPVQQARTDFQAKVEELSNSTKEVFRFSDSPDEEPVMLPNRSEHLISVGTELIRISGECVVKTRQLIESLGDFELLNGVTSNESRRVDAEAIEKPEEEEEEDKPEDRDGPSIRSTPRSSLSKRLSGRVMPLSLQPPPPPAKDHLQTVEIVDFVALSPAQTTATVSPMTPDTPALRKSLPAPPLSAMQRLQSAIRSSVPNMSADSLRGPRSARSDSRSPARKDSIGASVTDSSETVFSTRDSNITTVSEASTRATTPEQAKSSSINAEAAMMSSFASLSSMRSLTTNASSDAEAQLLQKTYANELTFNKDGQVSGGSLPALVEQLSSHDSAPDPMFLRAFFITFRKFCEPRELAQALVARFEYIGDGKTVGTPARLRIFNTFKHWLEMYWNPDLDREALGEIRYFALHKLKPLLPTAGERMVELTRKVAAGYRDGTIVPGVGRTVLTPEAASDAPEPALNKHDLNALRVANGGGAPCSVVDIDPLEVARQITVMMARTYCAIQSDEFLSMDWGKPNTRKAAHIRDMCLMNTDLAHVVGDTILAPEDSKKRAGVIKQWGKIGAELVQLNNYDSIMAIMCTINSSVIQRLKKTWEHVGKKTRARLDELDKICDMSKNYSALRKRMDNPDLPSLPFLGIFLTDLTFVLAGNPKRREIPGSAAEDGKPISVINFDMYMRLAKIIMHLQRSQTPYVLKEVPEMQNWLNAHLKRMRAGHDEMVSTLHRRSLVVEPKPEERSHPLERKNTAALVRIEEHVERPKTSAGKLEQAQHSVMERFDFFLKNNNNNNNNNNNAS